MKLPILSAFKRLSLPKRGQLFLSWALVRAPRGCDGSSFSFMDNGRLVAVLDFNLGEESPIHVPNRPDGKAMTSTFSALAKRLEAYLA